MKTNLKELRESVGLTQKDFAASLGLGLSTYNGYEIGAREPKSDFLIAVARKYNVTIDYLMGHSNDPHSTGICKPTSTYSGEALRIAKRFDSLDEYGQSAVSGLVSVELARCTALPDAGNWILLPLSEQAASAGTGVYLGPEAFEQIKVMDNEKTRRADFAVRVQGDSMEDLFHDGDFVLVSKEQPQSGDIALVTLDGCGYVKRLGDGVLLSENRRYAPIRMDESIIVNGRVLGVLPPEWVVKQA